jgi:CubicO group peptidase (beta-lactamase class C family)
VVAKIQDGYRCVAYRAAAPRSIVHAADTESIIVTTSFVIVAWTATILAFCATPKSASAQARRITPDALSRTVDSVAAGAIAAGLAPALGVAVVMDGRPVLVRSYGFADTDAKRRTNDQTLWYLASTSKSLTGFGVALLAHAGILQLTDPIAALVPHARWHPTVQADSLTLAHFLAHTHHVDDRAIVMSAAFTGSIPEGRWPALLAMAARSNTADLVYSNLGYNVAAMVLDAKRPEGWKRYLEDAVYRPAGMRETYTRVSGLDASRIAMPHRTGRDGTFATTPFFKTDATMNAAGGHLATLGDLARWTIVQMDSGVLDGRRVFPAAAVALGHRLLARHTLDAARRFAFFDRDGWASGWDIGSYDGVRMVSRFGSYDATRAHLSFLPSRRIGVVAMSNGGISSLTDAIAALAYDLEAGRSDALDRARVRLLEIRERQQASVRNIATQDSIRALRQQHPSRRPLRDFVGAYHDPAFGTIEFTTDNGTLRFRWGALSGPVEIFDAEKNQMRLEIAGSGTVATFTFGGTAAATSVALQGATLRRTTP